MGGWDLLAFVPGPSFLSCVNIDKLATSFPQSVVVQNFISTYLPFLAASCTVSVSPFHLHLMSLDIFC